MTEASTTEALHRSTAELERGLDEIRRAPSDGGRLELIARRPQVGERELLDEATIDLALGVVGDGWSVRGGHRGPDPEAQVTLMSSRAAQLAARSKERWALAGDQLYVDLDLSEENLPAGTRLAIGSAVLELSATPHTGCKKFVERFGLEAMKFYNSPVGRAHRLRGANAKVVQAGSVRVGDLVRITRAPAIR
ncbi:MAG: MOSC domain-containing protein [Gaiellaceae bacterium]